MPTVSEAMFAALTGSNAVQAIVGDRINPDQADVDAEMPYLTYQVSAKQSPKSLRGRIDISRCEVELTAFAAQRQELTALKTVLENLLDGKARQLIGGLLVKKCVLIDPGFADEDEPADDSESSGKRVLRGTLEVWF